MAIESSCRNSRQGRFESDFPHNLSSVLQVIACVIYSAICALCLANGIFLQVQECHSVSNLQRQKRQIKLRVLYPNEGACQCSLEDLPKTHNVWLPQLHTEFGCKF